LSTWWSTAFEDERDDGPGLLAAFALTSDYRALPTALSMLSAAARRISGNRCV
jgi:hypothetical protein